MAHRNTTNVEVWEFPELQYTVTASVKFYGDDSMSVVFIDTTRHDSPAIEFRYNGPLLGIIERFDPESQTIRDGLNQVLLWLKGAAESLDKSGAYERTGFNVTLVKGDWLISREGSHDGLYLGRWLLSVWLSRYYPDVRQDNSKLTVRQNFNALQEV